MTPDKSQTRLDIRFVGWLGFTALALAMLNSTGVAVAQTENDAEPDKVNNPSPPTTPPANPGGTIGAPTTPSGPVLNPANGLPQGAPNVPHLSLNTPATTDQFYPLWNPFQGYSYGTWEFGPGISYNNSYYFYPPIAGVYRKIDPNLIIYPPQDLNDIPPAPLTAPELVFQGAYAEAIDLLNSELRSNPRDVERKRLLGLAHAAELDFATAADILLEVYASDPEIAVFPLDGKALFASPLELRDLVVGAVRVAQKTGTARGWLLVAILIQAEGRDDIAFKMLQRAGGLGLDPAIVTAWPDPAA